MKRLMSILLPLYIIFITSITVYAAAPCFELDDVSAAKGRLIEVCMYAENGSSLSAASFSFTFNSNILEFRDAKCTNDSALIETNCIGNTVKAVYLDSYGTNVSEKVCIFKLIFKAVSSGVDYIDFTVSDCVNADIERINPGECVSAKISVKGSSSSSSLNTDKSSSASSQGSNKKSKSSRNSDKDDDSDENSESTYDNLGVLNPLKDNTARYVFAGISIGLIFALFIALVFIIGRKSAGVKKSDKNEENE